MKIFDIAEDTDRMLVSILSKISALGMTESKLYKAINKSIISSYDNISYYSDMISDIADYDLIIPDIYNDLKSCDIENSTYNDILKIIDNSIKSSKYLSSLNSELESDDDEDWDIEISDIERSDY